MNSISNNTVLTTTSTPTLIASPSKTAPAPANFSLIAANPATSPLYFQLLNLIRQLLALVQQQQPTPAPTPGVINGTARNDTLNGGAGNDKIYGNAGNDVLRGNAGDDYLEGGAGDDTLYGGTGNDSFVDNQGSNVFYGGAGGKDSIKLTGKFSDYTINPINYIMAPGPEEENAYVLTHRITGERQTIYSIESLQFADRTVDVNNLMANLPSTSARDALNSNRLKWSNSGLQDYSFTLQRSCFCIGDSLRPVNIEVRGGKVNSATFADNGQAVPSSLSSNQLSVNDLFKQIDEAIRSGAENVDVKYDPTYGFPTSIYIDRSRMIADEETSLSVRNFQVGRPTVTTYAVGEEDGSGPQPVYLSTKAMGEE